MDLFLLLVPRILKDVCHGRKRPNTARLQTNKRVQDPRSVKKHQGSKSLTADNIFRWRVAMPYDRLRFKTLSSLSV